MPNLGTTILAFDYGEMRIGVAVGNSVLKIAHPLTTITCEGMWAKIDLLAPLIEKWQPTLLVLGMPHANDNPQKIQLINTINNFAKRIAKKFTLPVKLVNEDFSSTHAAGLLREQGVYGLAQKGKLDELSACSILDAYFTHHLS